MRTSAERSATTTSSTVSQAAREPFVARAGAGSFFAGVQAKMTVNRPGDTFEQEADKMADKVMRMPAAPEPEKIRKADDIRLQKKGSEAASPAVSGDVQSAIHSKTTGGEPLAADVRGHMEPRFNADFSNVRVHRDAEAAALSNQLSARAFTYQNHVFFSRDQYQPGTSDGQHLLAHELTHTIQQGHSIQRSPQVSKAAATPTVQRLGVQDLLDKFAGWAAAIPGYTLLTFVLGFNPINMRSVARNAANLLRALIELLPGGAFITQALDNHGVINKAAAWVEQKIAVLGDIGSDIVNGLKRFIDSLGWRDIFDLGGVWDRAKRIFTEPISRLISFGASVASEILTMIKDAILKPLAGMAQGTRGYDLLRVILGQDPITGEPVPRSAENLLGGFMKLIGQEEIWENIKKGKAIARAYAWFQGALEGLMALVRAVPKRIVDTLKSLTFRDIITVAGAFGKILGTFVNIAGDFIAWGLGTIWNLLEIIFDVVKPGLMTYVKKTGAALKSILKNPLPFLGNLIRAAKLGFTGFADRIGAHLKAGLIDWLTGSLEGVYIPKELSLPELGKLALSVLGITWTQIRGKIVKALGPTGERIMQALETAFDVVVALVKGGPAALWELIKEKLSDLKDQVVSGIIGFVVDSIVKKAVPKLIAMFIPGAGFISAIISIYDTVMVFVQKIAKIIQVVVAFIDSIVTIAAGNITAAAKRVESILAGLLSLAISFLAGFLGLGKVTDKIMEVVKKVRATVDKALDAGIGWIVTKAKSLFASLFAGKDKDKPDDRTDQQKKKDKLAAIADAEKLLPEEGLDENDLRDKLAPIRNRYKLLTLDLVVDSKTDQKETVHFSASASEKEEGKPTEIKIGPKGPVTPLPGNSWIRILGPIANPDDAHEQVTSSASMKRRSAGVESPVRFMTAKPSGGTQDRAYSEEGAQWTRTNFSHGSKLAVPQGSGQFVLKASARGRDFIRGTFYADSSSSRASIVQQRLPSLTSFANSKEFLSEGDPSMEVAEGYKLDLGSGRALVPTSHASADHDPPISHHWTSLGGNNSAQSARQTWNRALSTYKIMSKGLNSTLGSRGATYTDKIGIAFRGPGE
jgi:hypothetical protein